MKVVNSRIVHRRTCGRPTQCVQLAAAGHHCRCCCESCAAMAAALASIKSRPPHMQCSECTLYVFNAFQPHPIPIYCGVIIRVPYVLNASCSLFLPFATPGAPPWPPSSTAAIFGIARRWRCPAASRPMQPYRWNHSLTSYRMKYILLYVACRSAALSPQPYGQDFKYREALALPSRLAAYAASAVGAVIGTVFAWGPLRSRVRRFLPKPGNHLTAQVQCCA